MPDETVAHPPAPQPADPNATVARQADTAAPGTTVGASAPAPGPLTGARGVPGFEVLGELGRGGAAVVYRARQTGLGREVALKMVLHGAHATADELDRFRTEAAAVAKLRHPHIVEVFAFGETADGLPYFAMEFCGGGTLARHCTGVLPVRAAVELVATVASAVRFAHAAGIVHRDLKPANVLLTDAGAPKVSDFGLAKSLTESDSRTRTGAVMGTPAYMAPEQAEGRTRDIGPAADVYALGAILFALLTGRPPFDGGTVVDTLRAVTRDEPPRPRKLRRDIPPDLEAIVLQCLEKKPEGRYATAGELADDLARWLNGEPVRARRGALYRARKWLNRNRALVWAGCAAALALAVGWVLLADAGFGVPGGTGARRYIDRHELSRFRPAPTVAELKTEAARQRAELTEHTFRKASWHGGWLSGHMKAGAPFDRADPWSQLQGSACLLSVPEAANADLRRLVPILRDDLFTKASIYRPFDPVHGFPHFYDRHPGIEGCGWALCAYPLALARDGLYTADERPQLLARLAQIQTMLDTCHIRDPRTGAGTGQWSMLGRTNGPQPNPFMSTLLYQGLIELRRAGLPWAGDAAARDELYRLTRGTLLSEFDGRGWRSRVRSATDVNDGLTLQLFALFLRAEQYGLDELPAGMPEAIARHVEECATRAFDHPIVTAVFDCDGFGFGGESLLLQRPVRFLWHPWAVECAARWYARLKRTGAPHERLVAARRVLGQLVFRLGAEAVVEGKAGYTFVVMETLMGLSAVAELE